MEKLLTLGIDPMAIVVYLANTGLLIVILTKLLYKPILKILDKRREIIKNSIEEAKNMQKAFEEKVEILEKEKRETEERLKNEVEKMRKFAEEKKKEIIAEMEVSRASTLKKTQEEVESKKKSLIKEVERDVKILMSKIILDIVENKVPQDVIEESIGSAWKQYQN